MFVIVVVFLDNVIICMKVGEIKLFLFVDYYCFGLYCVYWFVFGGGYVIFIGI